MTITLSAAGIEYSTTIHMRITTLILPEIVGGADTRII
jgi:hypothetical protein